MDWWPRDVVIANETRAPRIDQAPRDDAYLDDDDTAAICIYIGSRRAVVCHHARLARNTLLSFISCFSTFFIKQLRIIHALLFAAPLDARWRHSMY